MQTYLKKNCNIHVVSSTAGTGNLSEIWLPKKEIFLHVDSTDILEGPLWNAGFIECIQFENVML